MRFTKKNCWKHNEGAHNMQNILIWSIIIIVNNKKDTCTGTWNLVNVTGKTEALTAHDQKSIFKNMSSNLQSLK